MLPFVELDRINVHLAGRHVLKDVSWSLEPRTHWAFTGANGAGKSTLLRVIAGTQWIDYDGGRRRYSADGEHRDATARAATWIRYVSAEQHERYARLELTIAGRDILESGFDNSLYVHRALSTTESERVDALIERFDLHAFARRPLRELSTGQVRRLLIARALVREPRVLVLDEFAGGLDAAARRGVLAALDLIAPTVALIVASHRHDDFPAALTHAATLRDGRLTAAGNRPGPARLPVAVAAPAVGRRAETASPAGAPAPILIDIGNADVYRGDRLVLRGVSWQLRRGDHTAIRGANGAGKSTFAGLVAGTISAATGARIERFGAGGPFDIWKLKERVAHISDDLQIAYDRSESVQAVIASGFPGSLGLLRQPTAAQQRTVDELIERVGLEALRGRTFTTLSFGERRKVLLARSLVRRPEILILDEVWNGLDAGFRSRLRGLLDELTATGTTLVAVAHDDEDDVVTLARRVCTIEDGRVTTTASAPGEEPTLQKSG